MADPREFAELIAKTAAAPLARMQSTYREVGDTLEPLRFDALTGADLTCSVLLPSPSKQQLLSMGLTADPGPMLKTFAELQTITISTERSMGAVWRLGESAPNAITRGQRSVAGTLVFTTFYRDVFAELYHRWTGDAVNESAPTHVDQLPEFNILIQGATEMGAFGSIAIVGVNLMASGQTISIHDLYTESTYSYRARLVFPFVRDTLHFQRLISQYHGSKDVALSSMFETYLGQRVFGTDGFLPEESATSSYAIGLANAGAAARRYKEWLRRQKGR